MAHDPLCTNDYVSLNYSLSYTNQYLKNDYIIANEIAKHTHLFNHRIKYVDYSIFEGLVHNVKSLKIETQDEYSSYSQKSFDIFRFNSSKELTSLEGYIKNDLNYWRKIQFKDTLKRLKSIIFLESSNGIDIAKAKPEFINNLFEYTHSIDKELNLEFGDIRLISSYDNNVHYLFRKNGTYKKIYYKNSKAEQSKTIIEFTNECKVLSSKTFNQRASKNLLYECEFIYDQNQLIKVIYKNYSDDMPDIQGWGFQEFNFIYNESGLLIEFEEVFSSRKQIWVYDALNNPIENYYIHYDNTYITIKNSYDYDFYGNWLQKNSKINNKWTIIKREIEYY